MGYYPFGSHFFSDLTNYVRSGDFVIALVRESQDVNEYAFALGALSQYAADNSGRRPAVNLAVPILYPQLRRKFGNTVTYWQSPLSHIGTEFGFDVLQVAQGRYAPDRDEGRLRRRGRVLPVQRGLRHPGHDASGMATEEGHSRQGNSERYEKEVSLQSLRSSYEKEWGTEYHRPDIRKRLATWVVGFITKFGLIKSLAFRAPTPEVEKMFMTSFNATVDGYRRLLANVDAGDFELRNENIDLGSPTVASRYEGADLACDKLPGKLADRKFIGISADLRTNIPDYYKGSEGTDHGH